MKPDETVYTITWHVNPFRGDKFEDAWRPAAEAAVDFGATFWAFWRSKDDPLDFTQVAVFRSKLDFERYWYSDEISALREEAVNYFNKPVLPVWHALIAGE